MYVGAAAKWMTDLGDIFVSPTYEVSFSAGAWELFCSDFYKRNPGDTEGHLGFASPKDQQRFEDYLSHSRYKFFCLSGNHRLQAQKNVFELKDRLMYADHLEDEYFKKANKHLGKFKFATCRIFCGVARCGVQFLRTV